MFKLNATLQPRQDELDEEEEFLNEDTNQREWQKELFHSSITWYENYHKNVSKNGNRFEEITRNNRLWTCFTYKAMEQKVIVQHRHTQGEQNEKTNSQTRKGHDGLNQNENGPTEEATRDVELSLLLAKSIWMLFN